MSAAKKGYEPIAGDDIEASPQPKKSKCSTMWIATTSVIILLFVAAAVTLVVAIVTHKRIPDASDLYHYGLMMDAGSSGTRIHVYMWPKDEDGEGVPDLWEAPIFRNYKIKQKAYAKKIKPGLASFVSNPSEAGKSLEPLLAFAREHVPEASRSSTPIYLKATAGMRMITEAAQEHILASVRETLHSTSFIFNDTWAEVIPGAREGLYAWITVNYLLNNLHSHDATKTVGVMDLGGASTQIAFHPAAPIKENGYDVTIGNITSSLYINSFLYFGNDQARYKKNDEVVQRPPVNGMYLDGCLPTGLTQSWTFNKISYNISGNSSFFDCLSNAKKILALNESCTDCTVEGQYKPPNHGLFVGIASFYYAAEEFNITGNVTVREFEAATHEFCDLTYDELFERFNGTSNFPYIDTYCFMGTYIVALLEDAYRFSLDDEIFVQDEIDNIDLGWTFGAMLFEAGHMSLHSPTVPYTHNRRSVQ